MAANIPRLCEAMAADRRAMETYRAKRKDAVQHFTGRHSVPDGSLSPVPINVIAQYCKIILRHLIVKDPRFFLSTFSSQHKPAVRAAQEWLNREVERMYLAETEQRVTMDALFSLGITYVALSTPQDAALSAWTKRAGIPFACKVDVDDFGYDSFCSDFKEADRLFHRYRVPLDTVRDDKRFSKGRLDLKPQDWSRYNAEGDERIGTMGRGQERREDDYRDWVDLWSVYVPKDRLILTLMDDAGRPRPDNNGDALYEQKWVGPECGPYHFLSLGMTPGNAWPHAPIMDLLDLSKTINGIATRLIMQAESQKDLLLVASGAATMGTRLTNAKDGDVLDVDQPDKAKPFSLGGPSPVNGQFLSAILAQFDEQAGNLKTLGGLGVGAKTATQEQMLNQNSSTNVQDMQEWVVRHLSSVGGALFWYYWHDPKLEMKSNYQIPGSPGMSVEETVHPWDHPDPRAMKRDGPMPDVKCNPFSLRRPTPQEKLAHLDEMMQKVIMPMMPMLQPKGVDVDISYYLRKRAELLDDPDLVDIVQIQEKPPPADAEGTEQPGMPQQTSREYVRRDAPNPDSAGADQNERDNILSQMAAASGRNGQPSSNGMMR